MIQLFTSRPAIATCFQMLVHACVETERGRQKGSKRTCEWQSGHQRKSHWSDLWLQIALELSPTEMTTSLRAYVRVGTCACVRVRACVCACARVRACARARVRVRSWRFLLGSIWNQIRPGLLPQRAFIENFFPRGTWLLSLDDDIKTIYKKKTDGSGEERVGIGELTLPTNESSIPTQTQSNICSYQSNLQRYETW